MYSSRPGRSGPTAKILLATAMIFSLVAWSSASEAQSDSPHRGYCGPNRDIIVAQPGVRTMQGTDSDECFIGDDGVNIVFARGGNDKVATFGGDDVIHAGAGADQINAGSGADKIYGDGGDDTVTEDGDDDEIHGGSGADNLAGGPGKDVIRGDGDNDTVAGGNGEDRLDGGAGDDRVFGQARDDLIVGGTGNDRLIGGSGVDTAFGELNASSNNPNDSCSAEASFCLVAPPPSPEPTPNPGPAPDPGPDPAPLPETIWLCQSTPTPSAYFTTAFVTDLQCPGNRGKRARLYSGQPGERAQACGADVKPPPGYVIVAESGTLACVLPGGRLRSDNTVIVYRPKANDRVLTVCDGRFIPENWERGEATRSSRCYSGSTTGNNARVIRRIF